MNMKKLGLGIAFSLLAINALANNLTVNWNGTLGNNSILVDDLGGNDEYYEYHFDGIRHTATTNIFVSDGTLVDVAYRTDGGSDFTGAGLNSFATGLGDILPAAEIDYLISQTLSPLEPITQTTTNTGFKVEQLMYIDDQADFAILEVRLVNESLTSRDAYIGVANDWDVNNGSPDNANGVDESRSLVYQQDSAGIYTMSVSSVGQDFLRYRLGDCCDLTYGHSMDFANPYILYQHFINGTKPTEECDDGNHINGDGCSANCLNETAPATCGNSTIEPGEGCDDGNVTAGDGCDASCLSEKCGDSIDDVGEECDDGNLIDGDGCSSFCKAEFAISGDDYCGDSILNNGAVGNQVDSSEFPTDLESTILVKQAGVQSGQGFTAAFCFGATKQANALLGVSSVLQLSDDCRAFYEANIAICGNGVQNAGEACDDGNATDNDGCDANCVITACGNGNVNTGEECDDSNTTNDDGCSSTCTIEVAPVVTDDAGTDTGSTGSTDDTGSTTDTSGTTGNQAGGSGGCSFTTQAQSSSAALIPFISVLALVLLRRKHA